MLGRGVSPVLAKDGPGTHGSCQRDRALKHSLLYQGCLSPTPPLRCLLTSAGAGGSHSSLVSLHEAAVQRDIGLSCPSNRENTLRVCNI